MAKKRPPADDVLIAGPYLPPRAKIGDTLYCERHGEVIVAAFSERVRWPCARLHGMTVPILCGDLVRAVQTESNHAVAAWWGVSGRLVTDWRNCLGVERKTPGTLRLRQRCTFTPRERAKGHRQRGTNKSRERSSVVAFGRWKKGWGGSLKKWAKAEIRLLGTAPDPEIGRRIDRTAAAVRDKRLELGIAAYRRKKALGRRRFPDGNMDI